MWQSKIFGKIDFRQPKILVVTTVVSSLLLIGLLTLLLASWPINMTLVSPNNRQKLGVAEKLVVRFNRPIARRNLQMALEPAVDGTWSWRGGIFGHLARTAVFTPDGHWQPNTAYRLAAIGPTTMKDEFSTKSLPTIVGSNVDGPTPIAAEQPIVIELDQPNNRAVEFSFHLEPAVELAVETDANQQKYRLHPKQPLSQGAEYQLVVEQEIISYSAITDTVTSRSGKIVIWERHIKIQPPPRLVGASPQGNSVLPTTEKFELTFTEPMNRQEIASRLAISPAIAGQWQWESATNLVYQLTERLPKATSYSITLVKGAHTTSGGFLEKDLEINFSTVGVVKLTNAKPIKTGNSLNSLISLTFDQPVDQQSAEQHLVIEPVVAGQVSWHDQTLIFKPTSPLGHNASYRVTLNKGVRSIYGLDSDREYRFQFSTEEKTVIMNIAFDRQDRALSCEAAALKMALALKGVSVSEDAIMKIVGYDPTPRSSGTWGDPDQAYVGSIDGAQNTTGYGVHWNPIARAAQAWRQAQAFSGWTVNQLAEQLEIGNPIVVWGVYGRGYYDPWLTPDNRTVTAWKGEHTRTLIGFRGSVENPTSFILLDPLVGRVSWSTSKFRTDWSSFNNSGVVVY